MAKEKTIAQLAAHFGATERGIKMKLTSEGITESECSRPGRPPGARTKGAMFFSFPHLPLTPLLSPVAKDFRKDDKKWVQI
jgi:hypothetical protein